MATRHYYCDEKVYPFATQGHLQPDLFHHLSILNILSIPRYMGLYFTRGSLAYCAPVMLLDPALGMTITDVGAMTSAFPLAYGMSK